jgi:hypothetical protein
MADINIAEIEGDVSKAVADAQELLTLAEKLESLLPTADRKYVTEAQNVLTVVESVVAKLGA